MAVKAKDIAEKIGVSTATVSLVINGKPGISDKMRTRVIRQMNELGYGYLLENKEENAQKRIGFVIYKVRGELLGMNSFFPLILDGIELTARQNGYSLQIINIEKNQAEQQMHFIKEAGCAGYVIFATEMHEDDINLFEKLGIPFVIFDNYFIDKRIDSVKVNNEQGTYLAVKFLYEMGHRKIGYLDSGLSINSFQERRECALKAMNFFGIEKPEEKVYTIGYPNENAEEGMKKLLIKCKKETLPTAFLTDNDLVAIGAMRALQEAGYSVPGDISVIGFDDRPICTLVTPKLTTMQLPRSRFGADAVKTLIDSIKERTVSSVKIEIDVNLVERESVKNLN